MARHVGNVGGCDWGARLSLGIRGASDYEAGNGNLIEGSFKQRDIEFALGRDLSNGASLEFQYLRYELDDAEMHNQFFNIDEQRTDGFTLRYVNECANIADRVVLESWYNNTEVVGAGPGTPLQNFPPAPPGGAAQTIIDANLQNSDVSSLGYRAALTYGQDCDCVQTTIGTDMRYVKQNIIENTNFASAPNVGPPPVLPPGIGPAFDLPRSESINPGLFFQRKIDCCCSRFEYGGRFDYVGADPGAYRKGVVGPSQRQQRRRASPRRRTRLLPVLAVCDG